MLFLVSGVVYVTDVQSMSMETFVKTRLVDADDEQSASSKFVSHFANQTTQGIQSYSTHDVEVNPVITY